MNARFKMLKIGVLAILVGFSGQAAALDAATAERHRKFYEQEDSIYEHMKRYGINRDDMASLKRLYETSPPYSDPHVMIASEKIFNPGEHLRVEVDEFVFSMKIPDAKPVPGAWIWPYNNTRTPDPAMKRYLAQEKGLLKVTDMAWYMCRSLFPPGLFGRCETAGISMRYYPIKPEVIDQFLTPETLSRALGELQKSWVVSREYIERITREGMTDARASNRIVEVPKPVVINGRIWIRQAMDNGQGYSYRYTTRLAPDRVLFANVGVPYRSGIGRSGETSPPLDRAMTMMDEVVASIRIVNIHDDGAPDPFVVERVELGPLPVREKLPPLQAEKISD